PKVTEDGLCAGAQSISFTFGFDLTPSIRRPKLISQRRRQLNDLALSPISDLLIEKEDLFRERAMAPPGKRISFSMRPWRHHFTRLRLTTTSKDRFSQGGSFSEKDKMLSQRAMALSRKGISFSMKPWRHRVTKHRLKTTSTDLFPLGCSFSEKEKMLPQRAMALQKKRISFSMKPWRH